MSNNPAKSLPFYLIAAVIFFSIPGPSAGGELSVQIQKKQAIAYRQKGWQLQQAGNIEDALFYYQTAIILDPTYAVAYNDAGIILEATDQADRAKDMYLKAVQIDPDYLGSYSNLALFYEERKDYTNAGIYWIKRATFSEPGDPWAELARKRLEDIVSIYSEVYLGIVDHYKEILQEPKVAQDPLKKTESLHLAESLKAVEAAPKQLAKPPKPKKSLSEPKPAKLPKKPPIQKPKESVVSAKQQVQQALVSEEIKRRKTLALKKKEPQELQLPKVKKVLSEQPPKQKLVLEKVKKEQPKEPPIQKPKEPVKISLLNQEAPTAKKPDNKTRALEHLKLAKESFAKDQYVAALKEATVAEYFDSSNKEIRTFIDTIRKKLLK